MVSEYHKISSNIVCMSGLSGPRYERMSDGGQRGLAVSY